MDSTAVTECPVKEMQKIKVIQRMVVELILDGKRFLGGDKNEGETGGHDFGITISRATILMILSATGSYPVSPFRGKPQLRMRFSL